jgi:2,3-dihydroxyphenylpropionate 1,2-dioxygenase
MSHVTAAFAMTHTPGLGDRLHTAPPAQLETITAGFAHGRERIAKEKPDLIIALINDHFDMFNLGIMPAFAIGIADEHFGPPKDSEKWMQMERRTFKGAPDYARAILKEAMDRGIELTRTGSAEFVHNLLIPLKFLRPEMDIPIIPVLVNCFAPPLPRLDRAYALGETIADVIASRSEKVCLVASGGLSHWPPYPQEDRPLQDDLDHAMMTVFQEGTQARSRFPEIRSWVHKREAEMAQVRTDLINVEWDKRMLDAMSRGDRDAILGQDYETIEEEAGLGGWEILCWTMLMGAMKARTGRTIFYEPVKEWMGGVTLFSYE